MPRGPSHRNRTNKMDEESIRDAEDRIQIMLKKLAKTFPKFAVEHPEIYQQWGLRKEAQKAKEDYVPR